MLKRGRASHLTLWSSAAPTGLGTGRTLVLGTQAAAAAQLAGTWPPSPEAIHLRLLIPPFSNSVAFAMPDSLMQEAGECRREAPAPCSHVRHADSGWPRLMCRSNRCPTKSCPPCDNPDRPDECQLGREPAPMRRQGRPIGGAQYVARGTIAAADTRKARHTRGLGETRALEIHGLQEDILETCVGGELDVLHSPRQAVRLAPPFP